MLVEPAETANKVHKITRTQPQHAHTVLLANCLMLNHALASLTIVLVIRCHNVVFTRTYALQSNTITSDETSQLQHWYLDRSQLISSKPGSRSHSTAGST